MRVVFGLILLGSFPALASGPRCENVFVASEASSESLVDDLIRLKLQIDAMDSKARGAFTEIFRSKVREVQAHVGPSFREMYTERLKVLTDEALRKGEVEKEKSEETARKQIDDLKQWDEFMEHPELKHDGAFFGGNQYFTSRSGVLALYDFTTRSFVSDVPKLSLGPDVKMKVSDDHKNLFFASREKVGTVEVATGQVLTADPKLPPGTTISGIAYSPDGRFLAMEGSSGEMRVFETGTMTQIMSSARGGRFAGREPTFSPDGNYVFFARHFGEQYLLDLRTKREVQLRDIGGSGLHRLEHAVFSSDSKILTVGDGQGQLRDIDLSTGAVGDSRFKIAANFILNSPDGRYTVAIRPTRDVVEGSFPAEIFDAVTGRKVEIDLSTYEFDQPGEFTFVGDKLFFRDVFRDESSRRSRQLYYFIEISPGTISLFENVKAPPMNLVKVAPTGDTLLMKTPANGVFWTLR